MPIKLTDKAQEKSTYVVRVDFVLVTVGEDGITSAPFTPDWGLNWSLTDPEGNIINGRDEVLITPDEYAVIVLSGNDLALTANYPESRHVLISGTYSSTYGTNLPLNLEFEFQIENLAGVL